MWALGSASKIDTSTWRHKHTSCCLATPSKKIAGSVSSRRLDPNRKGSCSLNCTHVCPCEIKPLPVSDLPPKLTLIILLILFWNSQSQAIAWTQVWGTEFCVRHSMTAVNSAPHPETPSTNLTGTSGIYLRDTQVIQPLRRHTGSPTCCFGSGREII